MDGDLQLESCHNVCGSFCIRKVPRTFLMCMAPLKTLCYEVYTVVSLSISISWGP